ncbi:putative low-specificity L-threonine aldolase 1 [Perkinsus olseni]|nr:putative low-specificity L-threonine aldolase 1 [Perkinsus olseni]
MVRWGLDKKVGDRVTCAKLVEALASGDDVSVKMICIERGAAIRAVTHRHITSDDITKAITKVRKVMETAVTTWPKLTAADHILTIE